MATLFKLGSHSRPSRGDVPILQDFPVIYGLIMAALVGIVIVGGMRSIGAVASKIVPFMCGAYVLAALFILANNIAGIPAAISLIWTEAFEPNAMYGGFLGVLVIGVKRAVFSNEAGVGSAAIAHSAAKTDETRQRRHRCLTGTIHRYRGGLYYYRSGRDRYRSLQRSRNGRGDCERPRS